MIEIDISIYGDGKFIDDLLSGKNLEDTIINLDTIQDEIFKEMQEVFRERGIDRDDVDFYSQEGCLDEERELEIFMVEKRDSNFLEGEKMARNLSDRLTECIRNLIQIKVSCFVRVELSSSEATEVIN
jgi:hypothetical protein